MKTIYSAGGHDAYEEDDGKCWFMGQLMVDADGSPRAYAPANSGLAPLDYLANAGHPGNWWGIATQTDGTPFIQGPNDPYPGYYVSTTALKNKAYANGDPRREVNSEVVPFFVIPAPLVHLVAPVVLGCKGRITDTVKGTFVDCVVADLGPKAHFGEASMAAVKALGINNNPKTGGCDDYRFLYEFWPGVAVEGYELQPS